MIDIKEYKDLVGLLLGPIRERPGMYLGKPEISKLQNFLVGYNMGIQMTSNATTQRDRYFHDPGFMEWFRKKYNIRQTSFWVTPFLEEAGNDEGKALELFFKYLEEYSSVCAEENGVA